MNAKELGAHHSLYCTAIYAHGGVLITGLPELYNELFYFGNILDLAVQYWVSSVNTSGLSTHPREVSVLREMVFGGLVANPS